MKRILIPLYILLLFTISGCNSQGENPRAEKKQRMRKDHLQRCLNTSEEEYLKTIRSMDIAEKLTYNEIMDLILNLDWVSLSSYDPLKNSMEEKIYNDFSLSVEGIAFRPYYILFSPYEPENHEVQFIYADDTAHLLEFSNFEPFILSTEAHVFDEIKVNSPPEFSEYSTLFLQDRRGEIMPFSKEGLLEHNDYLLCSIMKHKEMDLYVKLVWHCVVYY